MIAAANWISDVLLSATLHETLAGGVGILTLLLLVAVQLIFMPRAQRRTIFAPLVLLLAHLAVLGLRSLCRPDSLLREPLTFLGLLLLLLAIGRSGFLVVFRIFLERWYRPLPRIFLDIIQTFIYLTALLITLGMAGVQPLSLLTGSALLTAIIGLSLRDTLGNLFAGLALQMEEPFEVGDWIQFDDKPNHIGQIVEINWRATKVITQDEVEIIVPNATLSAVSIINFSRPTRWSRRHIYVHAPYDVPPQRVQQVIRGVLADCWGVLDHPPASVLTNSFDERGVYYWVRYYTVEFDKRDRVDSGVRDRIWYALRRAGIPIPPPLHSITVTEKSLPPVQQLEAQHLAERERFLRCVDIFEPLSPENLRHLAELAESRLYAADEVVLRQGEPGEELFVIQRGKVVVRRDAGADAEHTVIHLGPSSFFGEMSLMTGAARTATVRTLEECELLVVGKAAFREVLESSHDLAERICQTIAERQANQARVADLLHHHAIHEPASEGRTNHLLRLLREFFAR